MPTYQRVIPRDLFNEAKLLKCLGQLVLLVHDGKLPGVTVSEADLDGGFAVFQRADDGGLYVSNVLFMVGEVEVEVWTAYNSKRPYPLMFTDVDGDVQGVLDELGGPTPEFVEHVEWLAR